MDCKLHQYSIRAFHSIWHALFCHNAILIGSPITLPYLETSVTHPHHINGLRGWQSDAKEAVFADKFLNQDALQVVDGDRRSIFHSLESENVAFPTPLPWPERRFVDAVVLVEEGADDDFLA